MVTQVYGFVFISVACPNLYMVETVDCDKISNALNKQWESRNKTGKLKVMVQVNTSLEDSKLFQTIFHCS